MRMKSSRQIYENVNITNIVISQPGCKMLIFTWHIKYQYEMVDSFPLHHTASGTSCVPCGYITESIVPTPTPALNITTTLIVIITNGWHIVNKKGQATWALYISNVELIIWQEATWINYHNSLTPDYLTSKYWNKEKCSFNFPDFK